MFELFLFFAPFLIPFIVLFMMEFFTDPVFSKQRKKIRNFFSFFAEATIFIFTLPALLAKVLKVIFITLFVFVVMGCSTTPPPVVIEKVKIVKQEIPEALLMDCSPPSLFDKKVFLAMQMNEREESLTIYSLSTLSALSVCNKQIQKIKELNNDSKY